MIKEKGSIMAIRKLILFIVLNFFALNAFAAESAAKEDTTPPSPEGALTASDIQPITSTGKPLALPATTPAPMPNNSAPTGVTFPVTPPGGQIH
jgi:hypothetical protein